MYKKTISRVACLALLLTLQCLPLRGQQLAPDSVMVKYENLVQTLTDFSNNIPHEKVYLHFDNTSYYRNDNIWFKCYVVSPGGHTPSALSKTLYVELLNPGGEVVDKRILKVVDGQCHGDFRLNHLPFYSGFYEVRAYTKYMLNFGEEAIFSRLFPVYDQPAVTGDYKEKVMADYGRSSLDFPMKRVPPLKGGGVGGGALNLKFFPEGGRLVRGVPSRLAFEATDETGSPIDITGVVVADSGGTDEPARTFATSRLGKLDYCLQEHLSHLGWGAGRRMGGGAFRYPGHCRTG